VGSYGLHPLLLQIRNTFPHIKLHLIGHSFGARLVTAAVAGPNGPNHLKVNTLVLLQAAFSHYGLARRYDGRNDGFFRRVITEKKVTGPFLITFTQNDRAVGLAYAIASRIANQMAAAIGGATDIYGGMGGNGALKTPEAINGNNLERGNSYDFLPGKVYNLNGDRCITGHSDICQQEVMRALVAAIKKT
jgi:pimeloyl-ACP methyl ester carboxylesterase